MAGQLGDTTEIDYSVVPNRVLRLEYAFDDWLGDDLLVSHPVAIVTERLAEALERASLSGFELAELTVSRSETLEEIAPDVELPPFRWLRLHGEAARDDLADSPDPRYSIVVSQKALEVLRGFTLAQCEVGPFDG